MKGTPFNEKSVECAFRIKVGHYFQEGRHVGRRVVFFVFGKTKHRPPGNSLPGGRYFSFSTFVHTAVHRDGSRVQRLSILICAVPRFLRRFGQMLQAHPSGMGQQRSAQRQGCIVGAKALIVPTGVETVWKARAHPVEEGRDVLPQNSKVLRPHVRCRGHNVRPVHQRCGRLHRQASHPGRIDGRWNTGLKDNRCRTAQGSSHSLGDVLNALLGICLGVLGEEADAPGHSQGIGDKVVGRASVDGEDGTDQAVQGVGIAADHRLEGVDNPGACHNDIRTLVGGASVAGAAVEGQCKVTFPRHDGAFPDGNGPGRQLRPIVQAEEALGHLGKPLQQTVLYQGLCALGDLLRRLKEKDHGAGQLLAALGQQDSRSIQGRCVEIVATAVHDARSEGHDARVGSLLLGDSVDIRPQGHSAAGKGSVEHRHNSTFHAQIHQLQPQLRQPLPQYPRGAVLLKAQLRVTVQVVLQLLKGMGYFMGLREKMVHRIASFP